MKQILRNPLLVAIAFILSLNILHTVAMPSEKYEAEVTSAIEVGIVPTDLQSNYQDYITREQFCSVIVSIYESFNGEITERYTFNDTSNEDVEKAAAIGVVTGIGNGNFNPYGLLTREQSAVMLYKLANELGEDLDLVNPTFNDNDLISLWAYSSVGAIQKAEIMKGVGDNNFSPTGTLTVEQSILIAYRLFEIKDSYDEVTINKITITFANKITSNNNVQNEVFDEDIDVDIEDDVEAYDEDIENDEFENQDESFDDEDDVETDEDTTSDIDPTLYEVIRVVDGDTIIIDYNGIEQRVRLIGVDTAESVHPDSSLNTDEGILASDFTKALLDGKYVTIELDVQEYDIYDRLLAYVYIDGVMLNKILLEEGYAVIATYPPNVKYLDEFNAIMGIITENGRFISASIDNYMYVGSYESDKYHLETCYIAQRISEDNYVRFESAETAIGYGYSACGVCQ